MAEKTDGRNVRPRVTGSVAIRVSHPALNGTTVLLRRYCGRSHWEIMSANDQTGHCQDGMTALLEANVELEDFRAETPRLVGRDE